MNPWKTLVMTSIVFAGSQVAADENASPADKMTMYTILGPTTLSAWTSLSTDDQQTSLTSAKEDALAFIGSNGEIRGARFEQASRYYRSTYVPL
ncbi:DUF2388 domain-containing protein [Pseudomonas fulva]|uniref:DUF2388 domain-containing protein n=1 Tax=Pseudomonas fulva TaxID=47880 RepID=UPI003132B665